jgi:multiple sugar transport system permease protein
MSNSAPVHTRIPWWTKTRQRRMADLLTYVILLAGAAVIIFPFLWMVSTSFKSMEEVRSWPPSWLPQYFSWENFTQPWKQFPFGAWMLNGFKIAAGSTIGILLSCSLGGFALAQLRFRGRDVIFFIVLSSIMLPYQVRMIPIFIEMSKIGWIDTLLPLIVPAFFGSAYGIFLMRQFFLGIPREIHEAGIIDGCSPLEILVRIFLPLSRPAVIALGVVQFITAWNDLLIPMIFITSMEKMPISLGLTFFKGQGEALWPFLMAAALISIAPLLVLYVVAQRFIIEGMTFTGLKR